MDGYLGEAPVDVVADPTYSGWTAKDWALLWIEKYGQIDGDHHKAWVLDQVARILLGTPVIVSQARWSNGETEDRFRLDAPPGKYLDWVEEMRGGIDEDGEREYDYSAGIAP